MTLRKRVDELKNDAYSYDAFGGELMQIIIEQQQLLDRAMQGLEALVRHDAAMDMRDGLEHCLELEEAQQTLTELKQALDGDSNGR